MKTACDPKMHGHNISDQDIEALESMFIQHGLRGILCGIEEICAIRCEDFPGTYWEDKYRAMHAIVEHLPLMSR